MTGFLINPGSGPVPGRPTQAIARKNMDRFVAEVAQGTDLVLEHHERVYLHGQHHPDNDPQGTGRWSFELKVNGRDPLRIDMPGIPFDEWGFVRMYVDGNSWMWKFGVECARDELTGKYDEPEEG